MPRNRHAAPQLSPLRRLLLTLALLVSTAAGTILQKVQNRTCIENCSPEDTETPVYFEQPVLQTIFMFGGEFLCLAVPLYQALRTKRASVKRVGVAGSAAEALLEGSGAAHTVEAPSTQELPSMKGIEYLALWIPAAMDVIDSALMFALFLYVPPSLFLILRGLGVVFAGILASRFLGRTLSPKQIASLAIVFSGVLISMAPDTTSRESTPTTVSTQGSVALGILLALVAQFFGGAQGVVEEAIFAHYAIEPILLAGFEGMFGLVTIAGFFSVFYLVTGSKYAGGLLDIPLAVHQMVATPRVLQTMLMFWVSRAFAYYFSLAFTRYMGATSRLTCRLVPHCDCVDDIASHGLGSIQLCSCCWVFHLSLRLCRVRWLRQATVLWLAKFS
ncbi:hypothetical protein DL89DRAFT_285543 [Linderina pennispora]|uniref:Integral membrane protein n=1 Tax=Linderina pennispora TaxID=61395 RepID=A0A1Y1W1W4_9FUNG|nr:uncharacterized protein DL89DRAFT_285543 [Linderina pennispora]ORX67520.1 hypothetical protein DL89DRAFT_285543 [Linderina pennispora]